MSLASYLCYYPAMYVIRTRFELVIFSVKGRCPKPLDERTIKIVKVRFLTTHKPKVYPFSPTIQRSS